MLWIILYSSKEYSLSKYLTWLKISIYIRYWVFLRFYLFVFREGKKQRCVVVCPGPPSGDPARNPGMCPHWESNQ